MGGSGDDLLVAGTVAATEADLAAVLAARAGTGSYGERADRAAGLMSGRLGDDGAADYLFGLGGLDLFSVGAGDYSDRSGNERLT